MTIRWVLIDNAYTKLLATAVDCSKKTLSLWDSQKIRHYTV